MKRKGSVKSFASLLKKIAASDRDAVVCVSGIPGEGKSTLSIKVAKAINPKFNFKKQMVFGRNDFKSSINDLRDDVVIADETINILFSREAMSREQKDIIKILDMCRDHHLVLILNIPNFWSLDSHIRESRVRYWVFVDVRGIAYVFKPDSNPFTRDKWHRSQNEKILIDWSHGIHPQRSPNYLDSLTFKDLTGKEKTEYILTKIQKRMELQKDKAIQLKMEEKQLTKAKYQAIGLLRKHKLLRHGSIEALAKLEDITPEAILHRIRRANKTQNLTNSNLT